MANESEDDVEITRGSDNVFADLDLPNPEEDLLKAQLAAQIQIFMNQQGLTQVQLAERVGLDQPKVSKLLRGRLADFSVERLLRILNRLGHDVEVRIAAEEHVSGGAQTRVLVS